MTLYLIGYKCSGKTTIGKQFAHALDIDFVDLDEIIEALNKVSIPELYASMDEIEFRKLERNAFLNLKNTDNKLIATGGGFPCWFNNMELMLEKGIVVYIKASDHTLYQRMRHVTHERPVLKGLIGDSLKDYIKQLRKKNEPIYEQAHITFDSEKESINEFIQKLELKING